MELIGYIKLYRKLKENPISSNLELLGFLSYLLLDVNRQENIFYHGSEKIHLLPGEKLLSQRSLAEQFNISISKVNRFLNILQDEEILKYKGNSKYTIVKLLNWDRYNGSETPIENKQKPNRNKQEVIINKENITKEFTDSKLLLEELTKFLEHYNKLYNEKRIVTDTLVNAYKTMRKKYTKEQFYLGYSNYNKKKEGETNKKYLLSPLKIIKQDNGFIQYL